MSNQRDIILGSLIAVSFASIGLMFRGDKPSRKNPRKRRASLALLLQRDIATKNFDSFHDLADRYEISIARLFQLFEEYGIDIAAADLSRPQGGDLTKRQQILGMHTGPLDEAMERKFGNREASKSSVVESIPNRLQLERDFALGLGAARIAAKYNKTIPEIQKLVVLYQIRYVGDIDQ